MLATRRPPWADLDPRITRVAIARAVNTLGLSLVMSFLAIYVVEERGYSAALFGAIALVSNLGQSATNAWAGELSDRIGRMPLIIGALTVRSVVIIALGSLILIDAPLWLLSITFVVSSALRGCFEPVAYALVADLVRPEQRVAAYGLQRMGTNLGWAAGPALGGLLSTVLPYGAVFYLAALGMLVAAAVVGRVVDPRDPRQAPEPPPPRLRLRDSLRAAAAHPPMVALLAGTVVFALVHTQIFSALAIYVTRDLGLAKHELGLLYTANGVLVLLLQWPALDVIHAFGLGRVLVASSLTFAVGFALIGVAGGLAGMLVAIAVITVAEVLFAPAHQAAAAAASDARRLGTGFGLVGFAQMIGVAFAPLIGGLLLDHMRAPAGERALGIWLVIAALALVMAAIFALQARLAIARQTTRDVG